MKKKPPELTSAQPQDEQHTAPADSTPEKVPVPADEEHTHSNYLFALKVLAVLAAIILIIIILKASGVPIAIKDWFSGFVSHVQSTSGNLGLSSFLF